jgi:hypothetical protein
LHLVENSVVVGAAGGSNREMEEMLWRGRVKMERAWKWKKGVLLLLLLFFS